MAQFNNTIINGKLKVNGEIIGDIKSNINSDLITGNTLSLTDDIHSLIANASYINIESIKDENNYSKINITNSVFLNENGEEYNPSGLSLSRYISETSTTDIYTYETNADFQIGTDANIDGFKLHFQNNYNASKLGANSAYTTQNQIINITQSLIELRDVQIDDLKISKDNTIHITPNKIEFSGDESSVIATTFSGNLIGTASNALNANHASDSDLLDGKDSEYFAKNEDVEDLSNKVSSLNVNITGIINGTTIVGNSDKLNNHPDTYFATQEDIADLVTKVELNKTKEELENLKQQLFDLGLTQEDIDEYVSNFTEIKNIFENFKTDVDIVSTAAASLEQEENEIQLKAYDGTVLSKITPNYAEYASSSSSAITAENALKLNNKYESELDVDTAKSIIVDGTNLATGSYYRNIWFSGLNSNNEKGKPHLNNNLLYNPNQGLWLKGNIFIGGTCDLESSIATPTNQVVKSEYNKAIGNTSKPVYVDQNGNILECTELQTKLEATGNSTTPIYIDKDGNPQECTDLQNKLVETGSVSLPIFINSDGDPEEINSISFTSSVESNYTLSISSSCISITNNDSLNDSLATNETITISPNEIILANPEISVVAAATFSGNATSASKLIFDTGTGALTAKDIKTSIDSLKKAITVNDDETIDLSSNTLSTSKIQLSDLTLSKSNTKQKAKTLELDGRLYVNDANSSNGDWSLEVNGTLFSMKYVETPKVYANTIMNRAKNKMAIWTSGSAGTKTSSSITEIIRITADEYNALNSLDDSVMYVIVE